MTTTRSHLRVTGAALLMVAGLACSAVAQDVQPRSKTTEAGAPVTAATSGLHFVDCDKLSGADVDNPNGETVATIEDLIVDRGSGRVAYAILNSGAVLGLGGKKVAVPYAALAYDRVKERYTINLTSEQIERAASFSPKEWTNLEHTSWTEDLENWWDETFPESAHDDRHDPFADAFVQAQSANAKPITVEGKISKVDREHRIGSEYACVEVKDEDGDTKHVVLGPSWYVMGGDAAPMRGDEITASVLPFTTDDGSTAYVAVAANIRGERIELRDQEGYGRWNAPATTSVPSDRRPDDKGRHERGESTRWGSGQLMLMSDLVDAPASANDKSGGEIQQVILEDRSGHIAFIGFDPNENVLGIADEIILVPWSLVSVDSTHEALIDANKDMLVASQEVPDDLKELGNQDRLARIYEAYGVEPQDFNARRESMRIGMPTSRWGSDGELMRAFRDGPETTTEGRVVEVRHETLVAGEPDAIVLVVDTADGERHVVVGPSWYVTRQRFEFKSGDTVSVVGTEGTVDGKKLIGARTVRSGERTIVLWSDDDAVWNDD